jgi:hypothetical protein
VLRRHPTHGGEALRLVRTRSHGPRPVLRGDALRRTHKATVAERHRRASAHMPALAWAFGHSPTPRFEPARGVTRSPARQPRLTRDTRRRQRAASPHRLSHDATPGAARQRLLWCEAQRRLSARPPGGAAAAEDGRHAKGVRQSGVEASSLRINAGCVFP